MEKKKLIEVALPLDAINKASAREKSIRHGHPSTLHLWWARRPLAAARAVIWASLVDDPSSHPEEFPTEKEQKKERDWLFHVLEELVVWENSNNQEILDIARAEILKYTDNNPPALLDPFAGGGAIPLEAQRLGLEAHAHDLNPVAVMINKAMIEIPPKFADRRPMNPDAKIGSMDNVWSGSAGLAEDVRYYGEWMKEEAYRRIGHLYPKVKVPKEQGGGEATVIAWIWARTVKCPNPACGCEMPLSSSYILSKKKGKEAWVEPVPVGKKIQFKVHNGKCPKGQETNKFGRGAIFKCPICGEKTKDEYVKQEGQNHRLGSQLMAVVGEGTHGRIYLSPDPEQERIAVVRSPENYPTGAMPDSPRWFSPPAFGMTDYSDLFTPRQLTALTTFSSLVSEAQKKAEEDALNAGLAGDQKPLRDGGAGARAYGEAVGVYLSFVVDKLADRGSSICGWDVSREGLRNTFGRQAIPMTWDYAEANPFSDSSGCYDNMLDWVIKCIMEFPASIPGHAIQFNAEQDCGLRNVMVSTDPPYYDNIGYADLADFFYVWMRQSLKDTYPDLFSTMLVPKSEELIATPYRHEGSKEKAKQYFEDGMLKTCQQIYQYAREDIPVTIYYAYKQSDTDSGSDTAASSGWETMLTAIIKAGFAITGTWPMRTEMANRSIASGTNALASSIVLVCRKRPADAPKTTRRNLINALRRELRPAMKKLQSSGIAAVDLAQSAIGPGMAVFSRYSQVLEADGTPMSVRSALEVINEERDHYFNEQLGDMDAASGFCVELYKQHQYGDIRYGEAQVMATTRNISISRLAARGVLFAKGGVVHLLKRDEISDKIDVNGENVWLLTQQLTRALEDGGIKACAEIVSEIIGSGAENAKNLAYNLYSIAEQNNWAEEAQAYNNLAVSWQNIQYRAAELSEEKKQGGGQVSFFE